MIYEILGKGESAALTQSDLQTALGFPDTRSVRKEIESERRAAHIICSCEQGYFLPANDQDVERYVRFSLERLRSSFITLKPALDYLDQVEKKETLEKMLKDKGFEIDRSTGLVMVRKIGDRVQQDGKDKENTL